MARRDFKKAWAYQWQNPLRYITARAENVDTVSHRLLMKERFASAVSLYHRDLKAHYGCVNAIEFSNNGNFITSGGDDRRVLLWNVEKALSDIGEPAVMKGEHNSNIFCLAINKSNTKIYSGGNDEQVVVHDIESGETTDAFQHDEAVYGLSTDPNNENIFASACDDGRVLVYDTREPPSHDPFVLASYMNSMHAVMYNPAEPRLLATANAKEGLGLWDIRKPRTYGGRYLQQSCMSVRINNRGTHLIALRRRLPPVLYELGNTNPLCDFDHNGYYNSCTMKSCSFAGPNDEYVLSGSDDFNLYMWRIPDDLTQRVYVKKAQMVLRSHRSIVNQVRYSDHNGIVISSGVEKIIKVWSPFNLKEGSGGIESALGETVNERPVYTHEEYINLVLRSGLVMSHDYSSQSKEEDPRMMAFFDSLVQRELEYWSSDDDMSSNEMELYDSILQVTRRSGQLDNPTSTSTSGAGAASGNVGRSLVAAQEDDGHTSDSSENSDFSPFTLAFASIMAAQETDASRVLDAHDESEKLRAAVQDPSELSRMQSSGFFGRKSISEIIAQNRKEVMRAAKTRHRNKQTSGSIEFEGSILSSSSSEWDSDETSGHHGDERDAEVVQGIIRRTLQQQGVAYRLKRLQALRTRLVTSDTENSGSESSPHRKRPRLGSGSSREETSGKNEDGDSAVTVGQKSSLRGKNSDCGASTSSSSLVPPSLVLSSSVSKGKSAFEKHEAGPYLQQTDGGGQSGHSSGLTPSTNHAEPGSSGQSSSHHRHSENSDNRPHGSSSSNRNGFHSSVDPAHADGDAASEEDNSQPVWTEFKRFKKQLHRATRQYRGRVRAQLDSSDED